MPQFGAFSGDDPLGIGLQERGRQQRERFNQAGQANAASQGQLVSFGQVAPLPNPMWDGLFQAMGEQGVDKLGDDSMGIKKGLWASNPATMTMGPGQESAIEQSGRSSNIGAPHWNFASRQGQLPPTTEPAQPQFPALDGLKNAVEDFTPKPQRRMNPPKSMDGR